MHESKEFEFAVRNDGAAVIRYLGKDTHIHVPETLNDQPVVRVNAHAFAGMSLQTVVFPDSLVCLEMDALAGCDALGEISLPGSVTEVAGCLQDGCPELKTLVLRGTALSPASLLAVSSLNGVEVLQHYEKAGLEAWVRLEMRLISG